MLFAAVLSLFLQPTSSLVDVTRHSSIIFSGTVEKLHAATPSVPLAPNTVVVRADDVIRQPRDLINLTGRRLTVRLRGNDKVQEGQRAVFFTNVYSAGASVGVDVVAIAGDLPPDRARDEVVRASDTVLDQDIAARLATADLIITGTVRRVSKLDRDERPTSEHDPEWAAAEVAVQSVEGGKTPQNAQVVTVFFSSSRDRLFYFWPKLSEGQSGIFILQSNDARLRYARDRSRKMPSGPFVVDRNDVQPIDRLERVRKLIKR